MLEKQSPKNILLMLMLLEARDGITPFPECGILKAKNDH